MKKMRYLKYMYNTEEWRGRKTFRGKNEKSDNSHETNMKYRREDIQREL